MLNLAIGGCDLMKNLVRNLQEFNCPSPGKKVPMDVHAVIDSILMLSKSDFKSKEISVALLCADGLPKIMVVCKITSNW